MHGMLVLFRLFLRGLIVRLGFRLSAACSGAFRSWEFTANHCWDAAAAVSQTENNKQVEIWDFYQTFFFFFQFVPQSLGYVTLESRRVF